MTLVATPNPGYGFVNWTENGVPVSPSAVYNFIATTNRTLVANFTAAYLFVSFVETPARRGWRTT